MRSALIAERRCMSGSRSTERSRFVRGVNGRGGSRRADWRVIAGLVGVIGFGVFASDPVFNGADLAMFASFALMTWGVTRWT